jgi:hypothetical protein
MPNPKSETNPKSQKPIIKAWTLEVLGFGFASLVI